MCARPGACLVRADSLACRDPQSVCSRLCHHFISLLCTQHSMSPVSWLLVSAGVLLLVSPLPGNSKVFTRCQLSKELIRYSFARSTISTWVCVLEHESGRMTNKVTNHANGTSYGLFQLSSSDWCKKGRKGGLCSMKCEDLLNEDLSDDVRCAKRVFEKLNFQGWPSWKPRCKGKPLPDVSRCS